jgi:hypothetical protein
LGKANTGAELLLRLLLRLLLTLLLRDTARSEDKNQP